MRKGKSKGDAQEKYRRDIKGDSLSRTPQLHIRFLHFCCSALRLRIAADGFTRKLCCLRVHWLSSQPSSKSYNNSNDRYLSWANYWLFSSITFSSTSKLTIKKQPQQARNKPSDPSATQQRLHLIRLPPFPVDTSFSFPLLPRALL